MWSCFIKREMDSNNTVDEIIYHPMIGKERLFFINKCSMEVTFCLIREYDLVFMFANKNK